MSFSNLQPGDTLTMCVLTDEIQTIPLRVVKREGDETFCEVTDGTPLDPCTWVPIWTAGRCGE